MLPIIFFVLFAACLALWIAGAPVWLVALAALATWIVFYFVLYPRIRTYKVAMGIDDKLNAAEASGWAWLNLHLSGIKVLTVGFLTSTLPFLGDAAQWLNGQNLSFAFDPTKPERQQLVTFIIGAIVFAVPFLTSWLHSSTIASAAQAEPKA